MDYTVSLRYRDMSVPVKEYLKEYYEHVPSVNSVFGFAEFCPLYGGRLYKEEITYNEIQLLRDEGITYRIPVSTLYFNDRTYAESHRFLSKYNIVGNSLIVANDELAIRLRNDYPNYKLEHSVVDELWNVESVNSKLGLYDEVVLHGKWNTRVKQLSSIVEKSKIRLFTGMGCSYECVDRCCYRNVSQETSGIFVKPELSCSMTGVGGSKVFDVEVLRSMGFSKFKVLPIDKMLRRK